MTVLKVARELCEPLLRALRREVGRDDLREGQQALIEQRAASQAQAGWL